VDIKIAASDNAIVVIWCLIKINNAALRGNLGDILEIVVQFAIYEPTTLPVVGGGVDTAGCDKQSEEHYQ
jgi:hypothetical protein